MHQKWIWARNECWSLHKRETFKDEVALDEQTGRKGKIYFMGSHSDYPDKESSKKEAPDKQEEMGNDHPRHILIVEDDRVSILYIKELINMMNIPGVNIQVHHVFTGERALEHIKQKPCHLVLMDLKLPGIDGLEATQEIKRIRPFLPVIAQTAFALSGDEQKALKAGCDDYISKPISEKDLTDMIKRFLHLT